MEDIVEINVNDHGKIREFSLKKHETIKTVFNELKVLSSGVNQSCDFLVGKKVYKFSESFTKQIKEFDIEDGFLPITIMFNHPLGNFLGIYLKNVCKFFNLYQVVYSILYYLIDTS